VIALLLLEGMLRIYNPFGARIRGSHIVLARNRRYVFRNRDLPKLDPVITETRNSLGFRGPDPPADFANDLTIVAVGGSTTHGLYLSDDKTWPAQLSSLLQHSLRRVWLDNAGLDGHSTIAHMALLQDHIIQLHPKVVMFLVGRNDMAHTDLGDFDAEGLKSSVTFKTPQDFLFSLSGYSEVASLVLDTYRTITSYHLGLAHENVDLTKQGYENPSPLEETQYLEKHRRGLPGYEARLKRLIQMCKDAGIEPVLITQPMLAGPVVDDVTHVDLAKVKVSPHNHCDGEMWWDAQELYNDVTRRVGSENGVVVVDLAREMPKSSRYFYDFVHFTNDGSQVVAEILYSSLCPALASKFPEYSAGTCSSQAPSFATSQAQSGVNN
jgi:lysophospholipase L1-like esterase